MSSEVKQRPASGPRGRSAGVETEKPDPLPRRRMPAVLTPCLAAAAGTAAFLVYVRTLAPSIVWGDSPELTAAAYTAGVAHPTGYPLYTLLAHIFLHAWPLGG